MKITKTRDEWYADYMDYRASFKYKKPANDFAPVQETAYEIICRFLIFK